jgi:hypothetical protein
MTMNETMPDRLDLSDPMEPSTPPMSGLAEEQQSRVLALGAAKWVLSGRPFGPSPDVYDLIRIAQWILDGTDLIDSVVVSEEQEEDAE